jgi:hypothetical protein
MKVNVVRVQALNHSLIRGEFDLELQEIKLKMKT